MATRIIIGRDGTPIEKQFKDCPWSREYEHPLRDTMGPWPPFSYKCLLTGRPCKGYTCVELPEDCPIRGPGITMRLIEEGDET